MGTHRNLALLDLAQKILADVIQLATGRSRLLFKGQLLDAAESLHGNVGEAFGRGTDRDRNRVLFIARGEAEEAIRHLLANRIARRIEDRPYWRDITVS
ncbi:MAG TPA: four helix bundle protein [Gemmatimonadaceae bacterium]|jgi:four helix bundle protein|nr:four helix bundle protein [Gemmatimonadaceae bacterium]